ncbi:MAG TPA: hypothetical protein VIO16_13365 [Dehalococcoidia bacterium]
MVNNAQTLYLIVDAADQELVQQLMQPFAQAGSVEVSGKAADCNSLRQHRFTSSVRRSRCTV